MGRNIWHERAVCRGLGAAKSASHAERTSLSSGSLRILISDRAQQTQTFSKQHHLRWRSFTWDRDDNVLKRAKERNNKRTEGIARGKGRVTLVYLEKYRVDSKVKTTTTSKFRQLLARKGRALSKPARPVGELDDGRSQGVCKT